MIQWTILLLTALLGSASTTPDSETKTRTLSLDPKGPLLFPFKDKKGNVLVTASMGGSRLIAIVDIANVLCDAGYNVTLLTPGFDKRAVINSSVHWVTSGDRKLEDTANRLLTLLLTPEVLNASTEDGVWTLFKLPDLMRKGFQYHTKITEFYLSDKVQRVFADSDFDVIIADEKSCIDAGLAAKKHKKRHNSKDIPLVMFFPNPDHFFSRKYQNYPSMILSEPSWVTGDISPERLLSFTDRLSIVRKMGMMRDFIQVCNAHWARFSLEHGLEGTELYNMVELYLINDHPVFSFPFLDPPNAINIGGFNLHTTAPIPGYYHTFLTSRKRPVILLSFGSHSRSLIKGFNILLEALKQLDVSVILKSKEEMFDLSEDKFLVSSWVPQRDLLFSGLITLFISHCGNNGRIETIYYNVPVICIPLFGDQYQNALYVRERGFGVFLRKEDISIESVKSVITEVITKRGMFVKNMKKASDILRKDPASGTAKILYYVDHLIKHGNLSYLQNNIVKKQSIVEMYNLDIIALTSILLLTVFVMFVFSVVKVCCLGAVWFNIVVLAVISVGIAVTQINYLSKYVP